MGNLYNMVRCPFHGDNDPSCAVYENNGKHDYYCWGCKRHGKARDLTERGINIHDHTIHRSNGIATLQKECQLLSSSIVNYDEIKYSERQEMFLHNHSVPKLVARKYGIVPHGIDRLYIPIYNEFGIGRGHQLRTIVKTDKIPKYILLPNKGSTEYPNLAVIDQRNRLILGQTNTIIIVESVLDALYLETTMDQPVVAILGHKLRNIGEEIWGKFSCINRVEIYFDDDAIQDAHNIADRLTYYYGYQTVVHRPARNRTVYQTDYLGDSVS